jgi:uncharacterized protein (TIRG00374 family)
MADAVKIRRDLDTKKSIILGLFGVTVIVFVFVRVIPEIGSYQDALDSLEGMTVGAVLCVVVSVLVYLAAYGLPFMAAAPGLSYWRSQQVSQAAFAIGNGVPAGGAFGLGVQYEMLTSYRVKPADSTAAITATDTWVVFVNLGFPLLGVAGLHVSGRTASAYLWPVWLGFLVLVAGICVSVLLVHSENVARHIGAIGNRVLGPLVRRFRKGRRLDLIPLALQFRVAIGGLVKQRWSELTAAQLLVSTTQFLIFYVVLRGVEGWGTGGTPVVVAFAAFAIAQLAGMIPLTPGGLGTVDAAMIALLTALGVTPGVATAADLVWRAAAFVPQMIIGVISLLTWSWHRTRAVEGSEDTQSSPEAPGRAGP